MKNQNTTHGRDGVKSPEYHPREWVDRYAVAYKERTLPPVFIFSWQCEEE